MKRKSIEEIFSDGSRWKQSLRHQGALNVNYGKPRDAQTCKKISDSLKQYHSNISPNDDSNNNK